MKNEKPASIDYKWHAEWFDPVLSLHLARRGSMTFVLEGPHGRPLSSGHHRLFFVNGDLFGGIGARKEPVLLELSMYRPNAAVKTRRSDV